MRHQNQRFPAPVAPEIRRLNRPTQELPYALSVTHTTGKVPITQVRHGKHPGTFFRMRCRTDRQQQIVRQEVTFLLPAYQPAHIDPMPFQHQTRRLKPCSRVVVSGNYYRLQLRETLCQRIEKTIIQLLRGSRRITRIEYVARHQQGIRIFLSDSTEQPPKKIGMLFLTVEAVEGIPQVPVACSQYLYHGKLSVNSG